MIPHHRVDGPGGAPALLLSNSLGTTWEMWAPQLPALTARFRVVRYEQRGHGGTAPPPGPYTIADLGADAVDLLDHLGIGRASFCGLSLGGMVGMWLAAHHPERVDRLVLACTAPRLGPPEAWAERAGLVRSSGTAALAGALIGRWFTPAWIDAHPEVAGRVVSMLGAADPEGYAGCCEAIGAMDQTAELAGIAAPTLVVAGAADPVSPPATSLELQAAIPGASLTVLGSAAHLASIEQPDRFTSVVVEHLAGSPVERGERIRRGVLGDTHVERSKARMTDLTAPFSDLLTRYAWGEIWSRPGLDRRTRSIVTVALLAGLGRLEELRLHVRGARRNGLSDAEIGEVLLHTAVYAGIPAANAAFAAASEVLAEMDREAGGG